MFKAYALPIQTVTLDTTLNSIALNADGSLLAAAVGVQGTGRVDIYDTRSAQRVGSYGEGSATVGGVTFCGTHHQLNFIATSDLAANYALWRVDVSTDERPTRLPQPDFDITGLGGDPHGRYLALYSHGSVRMYDCSTLALTHAFHADKPDRANIRLAFGQEQVYICGLEPNQVDCYSLGAQQRQGRWPAPYEGGQVVLSRHERYMAVTGRTGGSLFLYDLEANAQLLKGALRTVRFDKKIKWGAPNFSFSEATIVLGRPRLTGVTLPGLDIDFLGPEIDPGSTDSASYRCAAARAPMVALGYTQSRTIAWFELE